MEEAVPTSVASKVPFLEVCNQLEKISQRCGLDKKKKRLEEFVEKWRSFHDKIHKDNQKTKDSFYPAIRLFLPQLEKERAAYGIKETTLAKEYIKILCIAKDSPDALKLINFRSPKQAKDGTDFAAVAYFVLKNRCVAKGTLTIKDVNDCLDGIAEGNVSKNRVLATRNLQKLIRECTALEQKWLIRMILKDMKIGISQSSVFKVFHPDAEDMYNVTNNLEKVCLQLHDRSKRSHEVEISVFSCFRPMLAEQASPEKVEKLMGHGKFFIETKWDGERMQLHKKGNEYKYFSRGGYEYTKTFGSSSLEGTLTPYIADCFLKDIHTCILDGEMLVYHIEEDFIGSKAENIDIKSTMPDRRDVQPIFCVFDIVLYNDTVLTNKPLTERMGYMHESKLLTPRTGRIIFTDRKEASTAGEAVEALNNAIDERSEGIVVKLPSSIYKPNVRNKGGWLKVKPEYVGSLMDEVDVLIVGGYFGVGKRSGLVSHFMVAVAVPAKQLGDNPTVFRSLGRVGSGYSMTELHDLCVKLKDKWQVFKKKSPPTCIILGLEKPDLWLEPSQGYIVQIKATEITKSDKYGTGCTLRFPRVEHVRYDKAWYDCMTTTELEELRKNAEGKLASRHVALREDDDAEMPAVKKRRIYKAEQTISVPAQFQPADVTGLKKLSELLQGREICVVNGPPSHSKQTLEKMAVEHGATIVQHPGERTWCVVTDKVNLRVRNMIEHDDYDVVRASWLIRCVERNTFTEWSPADMLHASPATTRHFADGFDASGDSYTTDTTPSQLKTALMAVSDEAKETMTPDRIAELEQEYWPNEPLLGVFRLCRVYVDRYRVIGESSTVIKNSSLELTELELRFHGATIADYTDDRVTHVVVCERDTSRLSELRSVNRARQRKYKIVIKQWVCKSLESKFLHSERCYEPH
ncbi:PREDICTED: DNA ligase 4-like [Priapulus caudatus]|uniref:DNA ligase n=1 Tax=Priapulus caudatus TaxID=37621 RepID=A0ABM1F924_PRICU|nr:PREDICTED: DNA ligase 4-like [Priapulus caudatus]XP_014680945.1 PREDICTED: DNA ligase 4-like [Priapulus caudatus]